MRKKLVIILCSVLLLIVAGMLALAVQEENTLTGKAVGIGGNQAVVASSVQGEAIQECLRCKNVDLVWQTVQGKLGLRDDSATNVWDTVQKKWRPFVVVYLPPTRPGVMAPAAPVTQADLDAILQRMGFSEFGYANEVMAEAERQGVDSCYPLTVFKYESAGDPEARQAEVNLPVCQSGVRWQFVKEKNKACRDDSKTIAELKQFCSNNKDSRFPNHDRPKRGVDNCLDAFLDVKTYGVSVPTKDQFCTNAFNNNYRYALGLGQINILAGNNDVTIDGVKYTHCDLLDLNKNIKATVALLKQKGASLDTGEEAVRKVFGRYAGQGNTPQVEARYKTFKQCKRQ